MAIYVENKDRNILVITVDGGDVEFKIDCQYGTYASVSFFYKGLKTVGCGQNVIIGNTSELKGKNITFNGASGNPDGGKIRIIHTCYEIGGNTLTYIFPDDYTGIPPYDENDKEPSYKFFIKFV